MDSKSRKYRAHVAWLVMAWCGCAIYPHLTVAAGNSPGHSAYAAAVSAHGPAAWWRMDGASTEQVADAAQVELGETPLNARVVGNARVGEPGPAGEEFPDFAQDNTALLLARGANFLRVPDPGAHSPLDFDNGDSLTIEAWVRPSAKSGSGFWYIVGKGRTLNPGVGDRNQNYSLRLEIKGRSARLSFFFVDDETPQAATRTDDGHRWASAEQFPLDGSWRHVALTYEFGQPKSIRGYIDGKPTKGRWDLAGPTTKRPIVDDDDLWIGNSMGGRAPFEGALDEVAIYRRALEAEVIDRHAHIVRRDEILAAVQSVAASAPVDHVQYDVFEGVADTRSWTFRPTDRKPAYKSDVFALTELPRDYDERGIIVDRPRPLLVHAYAQVALPPGEYQLAFRSLNAARLYIDDQLQAETPFLPTSANGHGKVYRLAPANADRLSLPAAHHEQLISFRSDGRPHVISALAIAGLQGRPAELGELVLAVATPGGQFHLLGTPFATSSESNIEGSVDAATIPSVEAVDERRFDDAGWPAFLERDAARRQRYEAHERAKLGKAETDYWDRRHAWAREVAGDWPRVVPPQVDHEELVNNDVDRFILKRIEAARIEPTPLLDDLAFLRRVSLDVAGVIPTPAEIEDYRATPADERRMLAVDRLLNDPRWADHWVGYWQHVLAENPGLTKPTLNNTGPFRWFLHESFLDNKPCDRFVTELLSLDGGNQSGGPGGFAMATNNDVPMAQKAHIVGTAFLGVEMKCARCHDAPAHESVQQDLFSVAAMLAGKPLKVPASSSIPATPEQLSRMAVSVSLQPGSSVTPTWPFDRLFEMPADRAPAEVIRAADDSRGELAWHVTHPANRRFAQVIVNRLWQRYFGRGLVEPIHDWEADEPTHPQLLDYLADELVLHDYDLKHVARMILSSQAYQRQIDESDENDESGDSELHAARIALLAAPRRRRMSAEQLADSIFLAVGKPFDTEELCVNPDGRQAASSFSNLGTPRRAWEFACPSNERERPSMTLPRVQSVVDLMMAFGWRQDRQEPVNERIEDVTPLSPLVLANGVAVNRAIDLADHGALVELCLVNQPIEQLVEQLLLRLLCREPTPPERQRYVDLLSEGYEDRKTGLPAAVRQVDRSPLAWSNNLDAEANRIGEQRQRGAIDGDVPTRRLNDDWRARVEDMVWAVINSPEFVFVP